VKLPIFNADLPLKLYFLMAPLLIVAVHSYLIIIAKNLSAGGERVSGVRLDRAIILGSTNSPYGDPLGVVDTANGVVADLTEAMPA
jgi:hypothetical protein